MVLATSILIGIVGAVLRFQMAAEAAGFKVHAIGVALIVASVIGVLASLVPRSAVFGVRLTEQPHG